MSDLLELAIEAVREAGSLDDADAGAPQATGLRVRRSLDARRRPRIWAAIAAALGISSLGGVAFAIATGRIAIGRSESAAPSVAPAASSIRVPAPDHRARAAAPVLATTAPPSAMPVPIEEPAAPAAPRPIAIAPKPAHRAAPTAIEAAYRRAHELHFRGDDPAAALAAWDDYLRADPAGRFAAEARFNRAIDLIRVGRFDDARAALAPFAHGDVSPAGYHRDDAQALIDRLDAIGRPDSTIVAGPGTPP